MLKHSVVVWAGILGFLLLTCRATGQEKGVEAVKPLLYRFPHRAQAGQVTVYSDIGKKFSAEHARHGQKVWAYFSRCFAKTPGDKTVLYYTRDKKLYLAIAQHTPYPNPLLDARMVTALWAKDHRIWFIVPYQEPDFGTQLHELSHDFLYATYPGSADFPWIMEGTGMYWESGRWDEKGELVVDKPVGWYVREFKALHQKKQLLSLKELVALGRDRFWTYPSPKTYGQGMVLIHYLMKQHPTVMKNLFDRLNRGEIKNNDRLLEALQEELKMDLASLEKRYVDFGLMMNE